VKAPLDDRSSAALIPEISKEKEQKGPRILIAEDLAFNRVTIKHVLIRELGLAEDDFIMVSDGEKAMDCVVNLAKQDQMLSLILLDFNMPKFNGI
jgi:CheY-like chemotaxis protein